MESLSKIYWYNKDKEAIKCKEEGAILARKDSNDFEDMVVMAVVVDDRVDSKIWFLDSGCSNHMAGRKVWLAYFDSSKKSKVKLADNSLLQVEGTNDIVIQRSNEGKAMIKYVLYVPRTKCSLLSVGCNTLLKYPNN
ncbi:uncharacterized protein LOC127102295 [Lathyrus oleraceus]|uniref:uncharacterized protein LOC127102295 n=1 Tax=Pisum sativum TaxID=3888 RepID=UPI0021D3D822|nr:uncharacterized protein LOC127102295 [Pisum sativum]